MSLNFCKLSCVLSAHAAPNTNEGCVVETCQSSASQTQWLHDRGEVHLVAVRCCGTYDVIVLGLADRRLLIRYALNEPPEDSSEPGLSFVVPLPAEDVAPMIAMDLSEDAECLAIVAEDTSVLIVPILDVLCGCMPSWSCRVEALRTPLHSRPIIGPSPRDRGAFEMLIDLLGASGSSASDGACVSAVCLRVDALEDDDVGNISSCVWWTREPPCVAIRANPSVPVGDFDIELAVDGNCVDSASARPDFYLVIGTLSGQLIIIDVQQQRRVRSFNLAPIVWLQRCSSRSQEWLLIETAAEPKYWKLLLATTVDRLADAEEASYWSIVDGLALPTSANLLFELEPLQGLPPLVYQVHVLSGERCGGGGGGASVGGGGGAHSFGSVALASLRAPLRPSGSLNSVGERALQRESCDQGRLGTAQNGTGVRAKNALAEKTEILGILVADEVNSPPCGESEGAELTSDSLCLLLSLPSSAEDPFAKVDIPLAAAPPGRPGRRRLVDVLLLLGGGVVLSIVHVAAATPQGGFEHTLLVLSTAKPRPCVGTTDEPNRVFQELVVPGRVLGGAIGRPCWCVSPSHNLDPQRDSGRVGVSVSSVPALIAGGLNADCCDHSSGLTTLAVVWTLTEAYVLNASSAGVSAVLQGASLKAFVDGLPDVIPENEVVGLQMSAAFSCEHLESLLPLVCWSFDADWDKLMLICGRQALDLIRSAIPSDVSIADRRRSRARSMQAALSIWNRRSERLVPLPLLMECFGDLLQDVEVVKLTAPAILQVLMPHWPAVAAELKAGDGFASIRSPERVEAALSDGGNMGGGCSIGLGPSVVTWFLSLTMMLLVVMHPRTVATRSAIREYTRRGRNANEVLEVLPIGARNFGSEWQAWVSERVTLTLCGGAAIPPAEFALFADRVQQDFEAWWCREWRHSQEAFCEGPLTPPSPLQSALEPEPVRMQASVGAIDFPPSDLEDIHIESSKLHRREANRNWCARFLHLGAQLRAAESAYCGAPDAFPIAIASDGIRKSVGTDSPATLRSAVARDSDVMSIASRLVTYSLQCQGKLNDLVAGLAESTLIAALFRGVEVVALPSGSVGERGSFKHLLPCHDETAVNVLVFSLHHMASLANFPAAVALCRILWQVLVEARWEEESEEDVSGAMVVQMMIPADIQFGDYLHGECSQNACDALTGYPSTLSGRGSCFEGGDLNHLGCGFPNHVGALSCSSLERGEPSHSTSHGDTSCHDDQACLLSDLLTCLGSMPTWDGVCTACRGEWRWERADGAELVVAATTRRWCDNEHADPQTPLPIDTPPTEHKMSACSLKGKLLRGLERWLLEELATVEETEHVWLPINGADCAASVDHSSLKPSYLEDCEPLEFSKASNFDDRFRLLAQAAAAEECGDEMVSAHSQGGFCLGDRLGRTEWWCQLHADLQTRSASLIIVVLSVMAVEHPWVWSLPWTGAIRLQLSRTLFSLRSGILTLEVPAPL